MISNVPQINKKSCCLFQEQDVVPLPTILGEKISLYITFSPIAEVKRAWVLQSTSGCVVHNMQTRFGHIKFLSWKIHIFLSVHFHSSHSIFHIHQQTSFLLGQYLKFPECDSCQCSIATNTKNVIQLFVVLAIKEITGLSNNHNNVLFLALFSWFSVVPRDVA